MVLFRYLLVIVIITEVYGYIFSITTQNPFPGKGFNCKSQNYKIN